MFITAISVLTLTTLFAIGQNDTVFEDNAAGEGVYPFYIAVVVSNTTNAKEKSSEEIEVMFWSGANLFHTKFAMTTCQAIAFIQMPKLAAASLFKKITKRNLSSYGVFGIGGSQNLEEMNEKSQKRAIQTGHIHPKCGAEIGSLNGPVVFAYDLGIFEFEENFVIGPGVSVIHQIPVELRHEVEWGILKAESSNCYVAGWSHVIYNSSHHLFQPISNCCAIQRLQQMKVIPRVFKDCADFHCNYRTLMNYIECAGNHFVKRKALRCVFVHLQMNGSLFQLSGDQGGPIICVYEGISYFWGISTISSFEMSLTFSYVPFRAVFPYIDEFLRNRSGGDDHSTAVPGKVSWDGANWFSFHVLLCTILIQ